MSEPEPARQLLALLDDVAAAPGLIELSLAVAHGLQRALELVYVESAPALRAAALPFARVLDPGGVQWQPFAAADVESGYRAQAARVRALAERIAPRRSVRWSMRVVRGVLAGTALGPPAPCDLVLVACAPNAPALAPRRDPAARVRVLALRDDSAIGREAERVAGEVARALGAALQVRAVGSGADAGALARAERCHLLVLPRSLADTGTLAALTQPVLIVA